MAVVAKSWTRGRAATGACVLGLLTQLACTEQTVPPVAPDVTPQFASATAPALAPTWHAMARSLLAANRGSPLQAERVFANLAVAQYSAISRIADSQDGTIRDDGYGAGGRALFELERGAITGASQRMLEYLFPTAAAALEELARNEAKSRGVTHPNFRHGLEIGMAAAGQIVERARGDRFGAPFTGTIPSGPGKWIPNGPPIGATGANVLPFLLSRADQFRPPPPPAFGSAEFLTALSEIRTLSDTRTAQQLAIAQFWAFAAGTYTPPGYWNELAGTYITEAGLNERAAAHVFALVHTAEFDAHVVACYDAKYTYWFIRPSQVDPAITLPIGLPNHPSYPSGHSCNGSAATRVLAHFFPERAGELADKLAEAGFSRMYGGIHFRFDIAAAVQLGHSVADLAIRLDQSQGLLSALR